MYGDNCRIGRNSKEQSSPFLTNGIPRTSPMAGAVTVILPISQGQEWPWRGGVTPSQAVSRSGSWGLSPDIWLGSGSWMTGVLGVLGSRGGWCLEKQTPEDTAFHPHGPCHWVTCPFGVAGTSEGAAGVELVLGPGDQPRQVPAQAVAAGSPWGPRFPLSSEEVRPPGLRGRPDQADGRPANRSSTSST